MPIKAIILDTETTGFKAPQPIEVGYLTIRELDQYPDGILKATHGTYQQRFKPTKAIDPGATEVHGIYYKDLKDCPRFTLAALEIPETVEYLVCHNVSYDFRVLGKPEGFRKICTVKLAKLLWPELETHGLANVIENFFPAIADQLTVNAHGALVDAKLCLLIIAQALEQYELSSWEELYQIAGQK